MNNNNAILVYREALDKKSSPKRYIECCHTVCTNQMEKLTCERNEILHLIGLKHPKYNREPDEAKAHSTESLYTRLHTNTKMMSKVKKEKRQRVRGIFTERAILAGHGRTMHRPAMANILKFTGDHVQADPSFLAALAQQNAAR